MITDNDEDLYEGFDKLNSKLEVEEFVNDTGFQNVIRNTSYGRKPTVLDRGLNTSIIRGSIGRAPTSGNFRLVTASGLAGGDFGRPMTSVRAAGYSSMGRRLSTGNQGCKPEDSSEERIKNMEKKVNHLIEESCVAACQAEITLALEKAKEASRKERVLARQREQLGVADQINLDLTYSVLFNLANRYTANGMYQEALNTYQAIVRNKMFAHAGRLKVNMGNIYYVQKNYSKAIKFFRMGLDQVPNTHKLMRIKIMQNIGISFVKLGQFSEAITAFEHIMQEEPDTKTGFNLIVCYFIKGDRNKMKYAFQQLLRVDLHLDDEDRYLQHNDDKQYDLILEVIQNDELRQYERKSKLKPYPVFGKKVQAENFIKLAAKIISPVIESNFSVGYDWCIDQVKMSSYHEIAHDLEIDKAVMFLKQKDFHQAIVTLKSFERKDTRVACTAATNLSFLYFLEGDLLQAEKYADQALSVDRYNPAALVNKGNVFYKQQQYEKARDCYLEALQDDTQCVEALYNLGLCTSSYQLMDIYEKLGDPTQAQEWAMQLHGMVPTDPFLLQRLGDSYEQEGDKSQAFSYYYDSFKYYPCNFDVIEWLGAYYIESQFCEKAVAYFERASLMQPNQIKWQLMIASCHRRSGNYQQALETYRIIHRRFPENIECLQFLVRLSSDMDLPEAQDYIAKLKRAEKLKQAREQRRLSSSNRRSFGLTNTSRSTGSRENSASVSSGGESRESSANYDNHFNVQSKHAHSKNNSFRQTEVRKETSLSRDIDNEYIKYNDPLGPSVERPRTAARTRPIQDDFADEEVDENLLPD
ncbi:unnamed protein product [Schistosoma mattheei]|uniref:TPR_REGION domain-containing protein n=2 Tax=Schistosoma mattheei TaxID=31246 RepID=A0AA85BWU3_9TREM|nr:unnamed protein product [Schistosoma mattheei]